MELSDYPSLSSKKKYLKFSVSNFNEASVAWWLTSILKEDSNTIIYIGKDEKEIRRIQKNLLVFHFIKQFSHLQNDYIHVLNQS